MESNTVTPALAPSRAGRRPGYAAVRWLTTTDHKTIGTMYLITSFAFFCIGGVMALFMRAELARPGTQIMSNE
ncbi:cytochrome ubiquinol oxidase subunit I, partial [Streptomyces sp. NPDC048484]